MKIIKLTDREETFLRFYLEAYEDFEDDVGIGDNATCKRILNKIKKSEVKK